MIGQTCWRGALALLVVHFTFGSGTGASGTAETQTNAVLAHWSQIVGNSSSSKDVLPLKLVARFIVDGANNDCSAFELVPDSGSSSPTVPTPAKPRKVPGKNSAFQITVCQFEMFADWKTATLVRKANSNALATFPGPHQIGRQNGTDLVGIGLGDTGCRASDCQADNQKNTRFANVIQEVLAQAPTPDFVVHVGDYRYYNENLETDAWWKWNIEFFRPAQPLLDVAPIALSRGNHEECDGEEGYWYGERWYQFFEATTSDAVTPCPSGGLALNPTWSFDLALKTMATGATLPHRVVMIDNSPDPKNFGCQHYSPTSSSCEQFHGVVEKMAEHFSLAIEQSAAFAANYSDGSVWWAMHKPLWNYPNKYSSGGTEDAMAMALGNAPNQEISKTLCPQGKCLARAIMAGHAHMYQRSVFDPVTWPPQYVLGHSGVATLSGTDTRLVYYYVPPVDYSGSFKATVDLVYEQNGFLRWRRNPTTKNAPSGWLIDNCLLGKGCHRVSQ